MLDQHKKFKPQAIIFDKDGTLIDFDAMWGGWTLFLADELSKASGLNVRDALCDVFGVDSATNKVFAHGKLAASPMAQLYNLTIEVMQSLALEDEKAKAIVAEVWRIPEPVMLAKPLTDLRALFYKIQQQKIKIAIATADDRAPTQAMVEAFDLEKYISSMVCADDGIPSKPLPDMVLTLCERMAIDPSKVMVVGDTTSDMKMGRVAGVGLCVGVLSGVSGARDLIEHADVLIESIDDLHAYIDNLSSENAAQSNNGLAPDFAY